MFEINRRGANRLVILTKRYAFKLPTFNSWRDFLFGLLNNQTENDLGRSGNPGYCPVVFAIPGGFLTVMRRARIMDDQEFWYGDFDYCGFCTKYSIQVERKSDSFGWLDGTPV